MLNISTTKGYENFRATATIAVIGAPLNLLLILVVWWLDGPMEWFLGPYTVSSLVFWWISRRQLAPLLPPPQSPVPLDAATRKRLHLYTALVAVTVVVRFITATEVQVLFLPLFNPQPSAAPLQLPFHRTIGPPFALTLFMFVL